MTRLFLLSSALLVAAPATVAAQGAAPAIAAPKSDPSKFDLAKEKVAECAGEKFVFAWGIGAKPTKVTLCSEKGASTDEVIRMIEDAAAKIEGATSIAEDRRAALVQQMRAKVEELKAAETEKAAPPEAVAPAPAIVAQSTAPAAPVATAPLFSPLLPAPIGPKPRLSLTCISPEFPGGGECVTLTRDTLVSVKSLEPLPAGIALQFVRQGDTRDSVDLGAMRKGQTVRLSLPTAVCKGVVTSEVELLIVRAGRMVDKTGPYLLRC